MLNYSTYSIPGTTLQPQRKNQGRYTMKNPMGGICQTLGSLQKQPFHLPEETGVQQCATSYDIWCRDLDTDQTSTEETCGRQTKMERSMLNITYKDRKINIWIRERTKVIDIISNVRKMKWSWAGHMCIRHQRETMLTMTGVVMCIST